MEVWTYFEQKEREYREFSFALDRPAEEFFRAEEGTDGRHVLEERR